MYRCESWTIKKAEGQKIDAFKLWFWEDSWESLGQQEDQTSQSWWKSTPNWKDWCWSWNSNTLTTWCEEPTHWKRPQFWEILRGGEEEGQQRMIWSVTDSMDMSLSKLREIVNNMEAWHAAVHEVAKSWTWLSSWTGEGNGTPLQYSCLENPMDGGAW